MVDIVKQIIARLIQLTDQIIKEADFACTFIQDCVDIKSKTEKLGGILRQAACNDLYEQPARRIIDKIEQVLNETLQLVMKCQANGLRRLFTTIPVPAIQRSSQEIVYAITDVSWLLHICNPEYEDYVWLGLPPFVANEPVICWIWEKIAIISYGPHNDRPDAAASLVSLARDNDSYVRMIIEEGGVSPLLKFAKECRIEGQESIIQAIGLICHDPESIEQVIIGGVCSVFTNILKEGHIKVQISFAETVFDKGLLKRR